MNEPPVQLLFARSTPADTAAGRAPTRHSLILERSTQEKVGTIRLRMSNNADVRLYAGHIGYDVDERKRGRHYATYACLELRPVAVQHGFTELWITCDPDNWASHRTCERIDAELVEIIDLPEDNDMYQDGERQKCRYRWQL